MKLRFPENVNINLTVPENIRDIEIPPMLFISFLENAFKHGVSYQAKSFVLFKIEQNDNKLNCVIRNSKFKTKDNDEKNYSGIGLTNIKKSLELLFRNDYTLSINESENEYEVQLTIPVYDDKMHSD
jgi:LytS/YehU family sensor histidine kinase